jgi:serine/threonine protein kinase
MSVLQVNVFLDADGRACLADFGLITFIESIDNSTEGGNPRWMAPELLLGHVLFWVSAS